MLIDSPSQNIREEINSFVDHMFTINGLFSNAKHQIEYYRPNSISRELLLWLESVYTVSEISCFGKENHLSFANVSSKIKSDMLKQADYENINYQNCLDLYIAFSTYRFIRTLPKRKQVWPGRTLHI